MSRLSLRSVVCAISLLVLIGSAFAQKTLAPSPATTQAQSAVQKDDDEGMKMHNCAMEKHMGAGEEGENENHHEKGCCQTMNQGMMGKRGPGPMMAGCMMQPCPPFPIRRMAKACAGMFLLIVLLNILLSILVFNDMRKRNEVNGLWIPVVLIGGILSGIMYAIWRKGDGK
jgi:hypothetical protein